MIRTIIAIVFVSLFFVTGPAKETFKWQDEFCSYEGVYDPEKVTKDQLTDALRLIDFGLGLPLNTEHSAWKPEDVGDLILEELDEEYADKKDSLESLGLPDSEYFRDLRKRHLKTLDASYFYARLELQGYTQPEVLLNEKVETECTDRWGKPLAAGGDVLLAAWKDLLGEQMKVNSSPERLKATFNERYASESRMEWASIEVMKFGWWNCVNRSIPYVENDESQKEEFKKLFLSVKTIECDEP